MKLLDSQCSLCSTEVWYGVEDVQMEHRAELEAVAKELDELYEIIILVHSDLASALSCNERALGAMTCLHLQ